MLYGTADLVTATLPKLEHVSQGPPLIFFM